jgi:hypothetical protein
LKVTADFDDLHNEIILRNMIDTGGKGNGRSQHNRRTTGYDHRGGCSEGARIA